MSKYDYPKPISQWKGVPNNITAAFKMGVYTYIILKTGYYYRISHVSGGVCIHTFFYSFISERLLIISCIPLFRLYTLASNPLIPGISCCGG